MHKEGGDRERNEQAKDHKEKKAKDTVPDYGGIRRRKIGRRYILFTLEGVSPWVASRALF